MHVEVDGISHEVDGVHTILEALTALGHEIPSLCHDVRLRPHPVCRMCIVEVDGSAHPVPSCATPVQEGMVIRTHTPRIDADRRLVLSLLASHLPAQDEHPFARWLHEYGVAPALERSRPIDDSNPFIHVDMSRCIDCFRCVRICDEVQGQYAWSVWHRGHETEIRPDSGTTLLASSCVSCGACVSTCPTGALEDKRKLALGAPTKHTKTTCPYCGVGCELDVGTRDERIVQILPVLDAPVNKGHLCVKGRYAFEFVESSERLTTPLIREHGEFRRVSWDDALAFIARRLRDTLLQSGPSSLGVLGSARATNEENYVAQKFARVVLGTNNVDCCARVCHAPSASALSMMLGTGAATSSFDDIEKASTLLVCGANATEAHPVIGARIKQRALRGANLIVIDPRRIELVSVGRALHLRVRPGGNVPLLNAIAAVIVEENLVDADFIARRVDGWDEFRTFIAAFRPEAITAATGVDAALVREAARLYARDTPSMSFHGLGLTEHVQGTEGVMALVNLALLTGSLGKPGAGVNPLRGQNNVQGAAHMGCEPTKLTGGARIDDVARSFENEWSAPIPRAPGMTLMAMMDAAARGELKALWAMGYDVLLTNPQMATTRASLERIDLVVVQDIFMSELAREIAHVVLPSACSFEKDGTFMNAERRVQRVRAAVPAPGDARPDWYALCEVARLLGHGERFAYRSARDIWEEIRRVWPGGRGISYERIEGQGLQWPCPSEDHPGTELLHTNASAPRFALRRIDHRPTSEVTSEELPFLLNTGRSLYHFNAGTMTMRSEVRELRPTDRLDMSAHDASAFGFSEGCRVRVTSRYGQTTLPLHIDDRIQQGELFATFSDPKVALNSLTGPHRDAYTDTPEYKITAVRIERAD